jgi:hypothetical protein
VAGLPAARPPTLPLQASRTWLTRAARASLSSSQHMTPAARMARNIRAPSAGRPSRGQDDCCRDRPGCDVSGPPEHCRHHAHHGVSPRSDSASIFYGPHGLLAKAEDVAAPFVAGCEADQPDQADERHECHDRAHCGDSRHHGSRSALLVTMWIGRHISQLPHSEN